MIHLWEIERRAGQDAMGKKRVIDGLAVLFSLLLLSGCNPDSGPYLEVVYPSGYARTSTTWDELVPMEGTDCQLRAEKAEDYDKTYAYDLQILDGGGVLLYEFPDLGRRTMRGESTENGAVWICSEWWDTIHHNGYLNGTLSKSIILLVDMEDGAVLFQTETGEDQLYLTSEGTRCYFYEPGQESQRHWFGLVETPAQYAQIYYRDIREEEAMHTVYTFDYVDEPEIASYSDSQSRARFYLEGGVIRVVWESTDRVLNEDGKFESVFSKKLVYEISLSGEPHELEWSA